MSSTSSSSPTTPNQQDWDQSLPPLPPSGAPTPAFDDEVEPYYDSPPGGLSPESSSSSLAPPKRKIKPLVLSPAAPIFDRSQLQSGPPPASTTAQGSGNTHAPAPEYGLSVPQFDLQAPPGASKSLRPRRPRSAPFADADADANEPIQISQSAEPELDPDPVPGPSTVPSGVPGDGTYRYSEPRMKNGKPALKLRIDLNLEIHAEIKAKINGSITLSLLR